MGLKKRTSIQKDQYLTKSVKEQALYKRYYVFCGGLLPQGEGTATYGLYIGMCCKGYVVSSSLLWDRVHKSESLDLE